MDTQRDYRQQVKREIRSQQGEPDGGTDRGIVFLNIILFELPILV